MNGSGVSREQGGEYGRNRVGRKQLEVEVRKEVCKEVHPVGSFKDLRFYYD